MAPNIGAVDTSDAAVTPSQPDTPAAATPASTPSPASPAATPAQPIQTAQSAPRVQVAPPAGGHGILSRMVLGALRGAAGTGEVLKTGLKNLAYNSPKGQEIRQKALETQETQQRMQQAQQKSQQEQVAAMDEHTRSVLDANILTLQAHSLVMSQQKEALEASSDLVKEMGEAGFHIDIEHGAGHDGLVAQDARDAAKGDTVHLATDIGGKPGVAIVSVPELQNTPLVNDYTVPKFAVDPKTGAVTKTGDYTITADGHHTYWDALQGWRGAVANKDQQLNDFKTQQDIQTKASEIAKNKAESAEAQAGVAEKQSAAQLNQAYARQIGGGSPGNPANDTPPLPAVAAAVSKLPPSVQKDLQQYSPRIQGMLIRGAYGWIDPSAFPQRLTKGGLGILRSDADSLMTEINPNYTDSLYKTIQSTQKDYVTGKEGQSIRSFNQFLVHAQELKHVSEQFQRTNSPWLNQPLNEISAKGMGQPGVPEMMTAIEAARQEWTTFINSGYSPDTDMNKRADVLMSDKSTPAQIMGVLGVMGQQAIGRLDQLNESYKTATGQDYPNLVTPSGRAAGNELGVNTSAYQSGGSYAGGNKPQGPQMPPNAIPITVNGKQVGYRTPDMPAGQMIPLQ